MMRRCRLSFAGLIALAGLLPGCSGAPVTPAPEPDPPIVAQAMAAQTAALDLTTYAAAGPPRQSNPNMKLLLDAALDTALLDRTPPGPADLPPLGDWLKSVLAVSSIYQLAGTGLGGEQGASAVAQSFSLQSWTIDNARRYPVEYGRSVDAIARLSQAIGAASDAAAATQFPGYEGDNGAARVESLHILLANELGSLLSLLEIPGMDEGWRHDRLAMIAHYAPMAAAVAPPPQAAQLRRLATDIAACEPDPAIRDRLLQIAATLPALPPPGAQHDAVVQAACRAQEAVFTFEQRALPARKTGPAPDPAAPAIRPLLDTILDTRAVSDEAGPDALRPLIGWLRAVTKIYYDYRYIGTGIEGPHAYEPVTGDAAQAQQIARNAARFAAPLGRATEAQLALLQPLAAGIAREYAANPRSNAAGTERDTLGLLMFLDLTAIEEAAPSDAWHRDKLTAFAHLTATVAPALLPRDVRALRNLALAREAAAQDSEIRASLSQIAAQLPEARP